MIKQELEKIGKECNGLKIEERDIRKRISKERNNKTRDSVRTTSSDFPYIKTTISIEGNDKTSQRKIKKYKEILQNKLKEIENKYIEVENLLDKIESPKIRTIARKKYIDGKNWIQIGSDFKVTADSIRVEFDRYFIKLKNDRSGKMKKNEKK